MRYPFLKTLYLGPNKNLHASSLGEKKTLDQSKFPLNCPLWSAKGPFLSAQVPVWLAPVPLWSVRVPSNACLVGLSAPQAPLCLAQLPLSLCFAQAKGLLSAPLLGLRASQVPLWSA